MSELQVRHIASMLKKSYSDKIDVSDCLTTKIGTPINKSLCGIFTAGYSRCLGRCRCKFHNRWFK